MELMIKKWLSDFQIYWMNKDIEALMSLFSEDVQYYETPFLKMEDKTAVEEFWYAIKNHDNINVEFEIFSQQFEKYTILWKASYNNEISDPVMKRGVMLLRLNDDAECYEYRKFEDETVLDEEFDL